MGGMSGNQAFYLSLIRQLREWEKTHGGELPAIALTAFGRAEDRMRALVRRSRGNAPIDSGRRAASITLRIISTSVGLSITSVAPADRARSRRSSPKDVIATTGKSASSSFDLAATIKSKLLITGITMSVTIRCAVYPHLGESFQAVA
jgi:CheY-like chemotaxis protein